MNHTVVPGDSVPSIAYTAGLFPDTIWNHPNNEALKKLRQDMNVLFPGDVVYVPEKQRRVETAATDKKHRYRRKGVPCKVRLQLFDVETPRANQEFALEIDGTTQKGTSDSLGVVELWVSPEARHGTLTIGPGQTRHELQFGQMDPQTEIVGLKKRLGNLGYPCGEANGELNETTRDALLSFQRRFQLKASGEFDGPTKDRLNRFHDRNDLFTADPWLTET